MSTLAIDLVTDTAGLHALADEWQALWDRVPGASPFQSPAWLLPWWLVFGTDQPVIACLHDGERLLGLLPLYVLEEPSGRKLLPMGAGLTDYLDALLDPVLPADSPCRMLAPALERGRAAGAEWCDLFDVPFDGRLRNLAPPAGWQGEWRRTEPCPVLTIAADATDAEAAIPARQRRKLRMNRHRAGRAGGWSVTFGVPAQMLEPLLHWHAQRWGGLHPAAASFHHHAASRLHGAGLVRLACLRIAGQPAAYCYALADGDDRLMFYMIGHNPAFAPLSPGSLLIAGMIEAAIAEGRREIHFLRGNEAYKYAWGARDRFNAACRLTHV